MATTYTYNLNRPAPANKPSNDVSPMQTNTNSINSLINTDHVTFGTAGSPQYAAGTIDGFHTTIHLANQITPAGVAGTGEIYQTNATDNIAVAPQLFYQAGNTIAAYPLTRNFLPSISGQNGASFLPGGFIIQWGTVSATAAGTPVVFTQDFKSATIPIVTTGSINSSRTYQVISLTNSGCTIRNNETGTGTCNWIAIGQ